MIEHRNLSNKLICHILLDFEKGRKIDHFERNISEDFPILYDRIYLKFLKLELIISKAFIFSNIFLNFKVFIDVQDLDRGTPSF